MACSLDLSYVMSNVTPFEVSKTITYLLIVV
jgi:hypothetical protein